LAGKTEQKCYSPGEIGALAAFKMDCDKCKLDLARYKLELDNRNAAEEESMENSTASLFAIFLSGIALGFIAGGKK